MCSMAVEGKCDRRTWEGMNPMQTHMNWHIEIVRLEGVSHVSKGLQGVAPASLLEAECHSRFAVFLQPKKIK